VPARGGGGSRPASLCPAAPLWTRRAFCPTSAAPPRALPFLPAGAARRPRALIRRAAAARPSRDGGGRKRGAELSDAAAGGSDGDPPLLLLDDPPPLMTAGLSRRRAASLGLSLGHPVRDRAVAWGV